MARVTRTAVPLGASGYPTLPVVALSADITMTAADATNKEQVLHAANVMIFARNSGATPRTVTITSVAYLGRSGDVGPYTIGVGLFSIFGPFPAAGFRQSAGGWLFFEASHAEVLFACVLAP